MRSRVWPGHARRVRQDRHADPRHRDHRPAACRVRHCRRRMPGDRSLAGGGLRASHRSGLRARACRDAVAPTCGSSPAPAWRAAVEACRYRIGTRAFAAAGAQGRHRARTSRRMPDDRRSCSAQPGSSWRPSLSAIAARAESAAQSPSMEAPGLAVEILSGDSRGGGRPRSRGNAESAASRTAIPDGQARAYPRTRRAG